MATRNARSRRMRAVRGESLRSVGSSSAVDSGTWGFGYFGSNERFIPASFRNFATSITGGLVTPPLSLLRPSVAVDPVAEQTPNQTPADGRPDRFGQAAHPAGDYHHKRQQEPEGRQDAGPGVIPLRRRVVGQFAGLFGPLREVPKGVVAGHPRPSVFPRSPAPSGSSFPGSRLGTGLPRLCLASAASVITPAFALRLGRRSLHPDVPRREPGNEGPGVTAPSLV